MSFWKRTRQATIIRRLEEEDIYARVLKEIESGARRDGLWAKALQKSEGHESKAKSLYIAYRVQAVKDEEEARSWISESGCRNHGRAESSERPHQEPNYADDAKVKNDRTADKPLDTVGSDGYTRLMRAVKEMNLSELKALLHEGADPQIKDGNFGSSTALSMAKLELRRARSADTKNIYAEMVEVIERGAPPER